MAIDDVMATVLAALRHVPEEQRAPIDGDELLRAEARLGRPLPSEFRRLYEFSNGIYAFSGSLQVESAVVAAEMGEELADNGWPITPDLLVFGGDGSDQHYALWYPEDASPDAATPVVEIGEIFEPDSFAITGTSLGRFLRTMVAFHLAYGRGPAAAMDALGVPGSLRAPSRTLGRFVAWSDPGLPFPEPDPYIQRLTLERIRDLARRMPRG